MHDSERKIVGEGLEAALARIGLIAVSACTGGSSGGGGSRGAVLDPILKRLFDQLNFTLIEIEKVLADATKPVVTKKQPAKKKSQP